MPVLSHADDASREGFERRRVLAMLIAAGAGTAAFPAVLAALASGKQKLTKEIVADAEKLAGLEFSEAQREMMLKGLADLQEDFEKIRKVPLPNGVPPALRFDAGPPERAAEPARTTLRASRVRIPKVTSDLEQLAFLPVTHLAELVRTRKVSSVDLTCMYLRRLQRFDPVLKCTITLLEDRAMEQARRADAELARGVYRGPLQGIPWGAKDLFDVKGYPTTWGAEPYARQIGEADATIVRRLDEAGAVLVAKLTLGALAMGDVWQGGRTRNPWNTDEGSSGSSAGPAAATAAGLVAFAVGTETRGSIISPCTRCGATGLRPTFGRVPRHGAMALAWSMDKVGPICRTVEDCALVFAALHGPDGLDETVVDAPFAWNADRDVRALRVGVLTSAFDKAPDKGGEESRVNDLKALATLRTLGIDLIPIELPDLPIQSIGFVLTVEAAAAFDELTRTGRDALLTRQDENAWPNIFRRARMIPAVEYVQANRVRTLAMRETARIFANVDAFVAPTYGSDSLALTNLTGHPAVVVPNGFRGDGTPTSITFTGKLWGEADLLLLAKAYQDATGHHLKRPPLFAPA